MSLGLKLARPLMRVGSACKRRVVTRSNPALEGRRVLQGRDRSRSDDLDDDQHRDHQGQERERCHVGEATGETTAAVTIAKIGVRDAAREYADQDQ